MAEETLYAVPIMLVVDGWVPRINDHFGGFFHAGVHDGPVISSPYTHTKKPCPDGEHETCNSIKEGHQHGNPTPRVSTVPSLISPQCHRIQALKPQTDMVRG